MYKRQNQEGGILYIGLDNDGHPTGIVDLDTTQLKIADRIKNNILPSTMGLFDIVTEAVENMTVIKIIISSGLEKPYYINLTINGRKYQIAHAQTFLTPERMLDKRKIYMGDGHYEYFIRGMEEHEQFISVVGHTVTDNRRIWVSPSGRTIRIDCGAGYKCYGKEGTLGAIRLNDMREFYIN